MKQDEAQASNVAHQSRLHGGQQPSGGTAIQVGGGVWWGGLVTGKIVTFNSPGSLWQRAH